MSRLEIPGIPPVGARGRQSKEQGRHSCSSRRAPAASTATSQRVSFRQRKDAPVSATDEADEAHVVVQEQVSA
ncbi:hypothetical protein DOTSEDRAFT_45865 [Dothistroma septosporum NZE10]|uniref:Uncharacterized protein n=1 Tax=Dothistroma septosporum (strain NZE10 / CBS 128990) TaxID=675120 RepID=N1PIV1_DOTSN|nr:hypothetical protein DOTSEDRAFT_45865 [Dothistroma septosporum NZE10]